ncbi:uncharacterized protein LOC127361326 isoform X2 [Dicentrarchus labrax]|uniref:uncharacterized protein LOC127361326 isoform X2 n=1 Tax=Dicentrarchus labrax TaxID=13489 RepID=UPI0021F697D0|nr:uncharacterized protein LOC127361326 isoform X2 [Dicentrarchus labrax]
MANSTGVQASDHTSSPDEELTKTDGRRPRRQGAAVPGRRGQRGKRRAAEKRRGPGEKRRGQKEKRRGQEEKKEGVTVKRTWSDGKRRWDKKHYCVFCRRPQVKIARHLLRKHADQQEVATASTLPTGSRQRHLLLEHLRCRGNYMHNIEVIRQGSGEIVPWRQPSEEVDARNYLPCPLCLGFFLRADLWKHQASCRRKMTSDPSKDSAPSAETTSDPVVESTGKLDCDPADNRSSTEDRPPLGETATAEQIGTKRPAVDQNVTSDPAVDQNVTSDPAVDQNVTSDPSTDRPRKRSRVQAAASRLLPISSGASESCSEVLHRMNQDHVSHQVKSDWLICKYGNKLMGNQDGGQRRYDYVSQKLRELGRFLLAAKSLDSGVQTLQDLLAPGRLSLALAAARKASGYRWSRPPLAVKTTLKTVCEIAIGESLQDGDWEAAAKTTDFYHLLGREWDSLGLLDPDTGPPETSTRPVTTLESRLQTPVTVPAGPRKVRRRPWSSAEKEAVWRQLGVHVLVQSVPGKEVCQRCLDLEPVLRGRHWKDIKNQVHNQIQSQKKQQFHAQMDQQDQEQQDQIQNQKKQQYQTQMDQQGKDHIQNQKKQQYQVQIDHQDQIQNQKKQQYQAQLDHQDHLIHKKQLCHSRLDHQDHIQVHKKQLYQMETQGLQTPLDRDSSVLTGPLYAPDGPHRGPGQSVLERDPSISPYPHRTLGPHMDQLLSRTEWTDETLTQHYVVSRNLIQDLAPGGPPANPHSGHVHF